MATQAWATDPGSGVLGAVIVPTPAIGVNDRVLGARFTFRIDENGTTPIGGHSRRVWMQFPLIKYTNGAPDYSAIRNLVNQLEHYTLSGLRQGQGYGWQWPGTPKPQQVYQNPQGNADIWMFNGVQIYGTNAETEFIGMKDVTCIPSTPCDAQTVWGPWSLGIDGTWGVNSLINYDTEALGSSEVTVEWTRTLTQGSYAPGHLDAGWRMVCWDDLSHLTTPGDCTIPPVNPPNDQCTNGKCWIWSNYLLADTYWSWNMKVTLSGGRVYSSWALTKNWGEAIDPVTPISYLTEMNPESELTSQPYRAKFWNHQLYVRRCGGTPNCTATPAWENENQVTLGHNGWLSTTHMHYSNPPTVWGGGLHLTDDAAFSGLYYQYPLVYGTQATIYAP
jgi:hypothetical protein